MKFKSITIAAAMGALLFGAAGASSMADADVRNQRVGGEMRGANFNMQRPGVNNSDRGSIRADRGGNRNWRGNNHGNWDNDHDSRGRNYGRRGGGVGVYLSLGEGSGCNYAYRKWQNSGSRYWRSRYYDCIG